MLAVASADGRTRCTRLAEAGSLRVRFPNHDGDTLEAVMLNTAGGIAGGDRLEFNLTVGAGARLTAATAAAEKVYRSLGTAASVRTVLTVEAGGTLHWIPQETILFDGADLRRTIDVALAPETSVVLAEAIVFGRTAMGEQVRSGRLVDRWRVRRGGRLIFADAVHLNGAIATRLAEPAVAGGACAIATVLLAPADDRRVIALRSRDFVGEVGVSAWNGLALARLLARDGQALRRDLKTLLAAAGVALPRLWLN